jgi:RND family efflux transporter MFP subunit
LQLAQLTAGRAEDLVKRNTISRQEHDQASSDLSAKRALVDSGAANVQRLEQLQSFQKIVAPFDGVITARNTDIGALIQAGDTTSARELFHLADNHVLRVYFSVPEVYASTIKAGAQAAIAFDAFPGEKFTGRLMRDSAAIDPRSHTLLVEADVENSSGRLLPGGYATVHLKLPATEGTVTVPANTLLFRAEGARVAVVRNGHIVLVPINIGRDHGHSLEVSGSLTPNDAVVLDPSDSLAEGAAVISEEAAKAGS